MKKNKKKSYCVRLSDDAVKGIKNVYPNLSVQDIIKFMFSESIYNQNKRGH